MRRPATLTPRTRPWTCSKSIDYVAKGLRDHYEEAGADVPPDARERLERVVDDVERQIE